MKVKKLMISINKMGSKGCTWSNLNSPGTENPLPYPISRLGLRSDLAYSFFSPIGKVDKNLKLSCVMSIVKYVFTTITND